MGGKGRMCISRSHPKAMRLCPAQGAQLPCTYPGTPVSRLARQACFSLWGKRGSVGAVGTGAVGTGAVVLGTLTHRSAFVTFLSSLSLRHKSVGTGQERQAQVTSIPLLPGSPAVLRATVPHSPLSHTTSLPRSPGCPGVPARPGSPFSPGSPGSP